MLKFLSFSFFIWRVGLLVVAALATFFLVFAPSYPYWETLLLPSGLPDWLWSWAGFDGVHYLTIGQFGYTAQYTQAFFPFYPLLIRLISPIFLGNFILSGLVVSNVLFLLALFLFYKLVSLDFAKNIPWMIVFLLVFPTSFFFGSLYNESLFLCLVLESFLAARKKKWWLAGILGGLASLTRLVGLFLLPALLWEWYISSKPKINLRFLWLGLIPLGLASYMFYLQKAFGDALYFLHAQPFFGAQRTGGEIILLPQVIWRYFKILTTVPVFAYDFWVALAELTTFAFVTGILLLAHKRGVRLSYLIFSWLVFLTPTLTGTFSSLPRYVLPVFPTFIVLGNLTNNRIKILLACLSTILLVLAAAFFSRGWWVS